MPNCKHGVKKFFILTAASFACVSLSAQSMPSFPSVSMPQTPSFPEVSSSQGSSSSSQSNSSSSSSSSSSANGTSSSVTASDLARMTSLGALDTLSSLLGTSSSSSSLSSLYTSTNSTTTNLLLEQILNELEVLIANPAAVAVSGGGSVSIQETSDTKSETGGTAAVSLTLIDEDGNPGGVMTAESDDTSTTAGTDGTSNTQGIDGTSDATNASYTEAQSAVRARPRILRFLVNGYNILGTCTQVYISTPEDDGTFLVTGDRRYTSDGKTRSETFHILFKADQTQNGLLTYQTAAAVSQDYLNQYSFLYQLSQRKNMTATKTGNLVTMRTNDSNWKLELLIDLGEQGTK